MSSSQAKSDQYNRTVEQAELLLIAMTESHFRVSPDFQEQQDGTEKFLAQDLIGEPLQDGEENSLVGQVRCRMWMSPPGSERSDTIEGREKAFTEALFACEVVYTVVFAMPGQHEQSLLNAFFERTGTFATWPYFRAHVAHVASESCLDVPILPVKKLFHAVERAGGYREGGTNLPDRKVAQGGK